MNDAVVDHFLFLVTADPDDLRHVAVRRPEFQRAFLAIRENLAAVFLDLFYRGFAVLHFDPEVMDAWAVADQLGFRFILAVIDHQREIDIAVCHMARGMTARVARLGLVDAKHVLVEFRRLLEVLDLERDVYDASHVPLLGSGTSRIYPPYGVVMAKPDIRLVLSKIPNDQGAR